MKDKMTRREKIIFQKVAGLILLLLSIGLYFLVASGNSITDKDGTGLIVAFALSLYLIFSREAIF